MPLLQFRCRECGYGASTKAAPPRCPMCGKTAWKKDLPSLLDDVALDLAAAARSAAQHAGADADAPLLREESELSVFPGVPLS